MKKSAKRVITMVSVVGVLLLGHLSALAQSASTSRDIDLVMINGQVKTPSGWMEALPIRNGTIVAIGDSKSIGGMRTNDTEVQNLAH